MHSKFGVMNMVLIKVGGRDVMSRRKKKFSCICVLLVAPFVILKEIINYVLHFNPIPLIEGRCGRKKKKWF